MTVIANAFISIIFKISSNANNSKARPGLIKSKTTCLTVVTATTGPNLGEWRYVYAQLAVGVKAWFTLQILVMPC